MSPIAIVGISCRFAGAPNPGALWRAVTDGRSAISPFKEDVARPVGLPGVFPRPYPTHGGLLGHASDPDDLYSCVPREQTFPRQINAGENPDLYFAVRLAFDALADAGVRPRAHDPVRGTVRFGYAPPFTAADVNWLDHTLFVDQTIEILRRYFHAPSESMDDVRARLVDALPAAAPGAFLSGCGHRMADWIAQECGFSGDATALDAGVFTGIAALEAAADDLRSGRADIALAGALQPPLTREFLEGAAGEVLFSQSAELVPFDRSASGTIPGEGGAFFVLKRETDALRDHDRVYALLRGFSFGRSPADELLSAAADCAGVQVHAIRLVEADGSGVPEADAEEAQAVCRLWGEHRPGGPLVGLGSVKGNIGHCFTAAAAAGVLKAAFALHAKVLPPQVAAERPLDCLSNLSSPAYLLNTARPWITGDANAPRCAAVLARDFSGRGAALVLGEERATAVSEKEGKEKRHGR